MHHLPLYANRYRKRSLNCLCQCHQFRHRRNQINILYTNRMSWLQLHYVIRRRLYHIARYPHIYIRHHHRRHTHHYKVFKHFVIIQHHSIIDILNIVNHHLPRIFSCKIQCLFHIYPLFIQVPTPRLRQYHNSSPLSFVLLYAPQNHDLPPPHIATPSRLVSVASPLATP